MRMCPRAASSATTEGLFTLMVDDVTAIRTHIGLASSPDHVTKAVSGDAVRTTNL